MKQMDKDTKFAHLGKPGTVFSKGFARRFAKIRSYVDFSDAVILDQGAGDGVWMFEFAKYTDATNVYGQDIDKEAKSNFISLISNLKDEETIPPENFKVCHAEELVFADETFDIVFSNEVLEHVDNDVQAVAEAWRVLKPGGHFIFFTPNSGWPFETHGIFFKNKYYWGNIPLLPWLPKRIQNKCAPHVRNYTNGEITKLLKYNNWKVVHRSHVFPGFDGAVRRFGIFGKALQLFFHTIEKTPLHWFGISHVVVVRKG